MDIIGLVPAGGMASRLGKLPCSKEILPIRDKSGKVTVLSANLLHYYHLAGIQEVLFIIRKGKWDIPEYFGDGSDYGMNIGYLMMNLPYGTPFTLDQAFAFIRGKIVALGFPDILFEPENAFVPLKEKLLSGQADVLLGIVPCPQYLKSDMIEFDDAGQIKEIVIKQIRPDLKYGWFVALWRPSFTLFMHDYLIRLIRSGSQGKIIQHDGSLREVFVGDVILDAMNTGLKVDHLIFEEGYYRDLGTGDELYKISG
jgi:glucose-1-phosphate thymidylyltransferase